MRHFYDICYLGSNNLQELTEFYKRFGFDGFVLLIKDYDSKKIFDIKKQILDLNEQIDIKIGIELELKNKNKFLNQLRKLRTEFPIIAVRGGNLDTNRLVCENNLIDILINPHKNRKTDSGFDKIMGNFAKTNNVAIGIDIRDFLFSHKKNRVFLSQSLMNNIKICDKVGTNIVIYSGAISKWDIRDPITMSSIGFLLGLNKDKSLKPLQNLYKIIKRNEEKIDSDWIMDGVRLVN